MANSSPPPLEQIDRALIVFYGRATNVSRGDKFKYEDNYGVQCNIEILGLYERGRDRLLHVIYLPRGVSVLVSIDDFNDQLDMYAAYLIEKNKEVEYIKCEEADTSICIGFNEVAVRVGDYIVFSDKGTQSTLIYMKNIKARTTFSVEYMIQYNSATYINKMTQDQLQDKVDFYTRSGYDIEVVSSKTQLAKFRRSQEKYSKFEFSD